MALAYHAQMVRSLLDPPLAELGFTRRKSAWQRRTGEIRFFIDAQKSQYSARYYINVGLVFHAVNAEAWPTQPYWNVQTRAGALLGRETAAGTLDWLDFETPAPDDARHAQSRALVAALAPFVEAAESFDSLTGTAHGRTLLSASLVDGDASAILPRWQ